MGLGVSSNAATAQILPQYLLWLQQGQQGIQQMLRLG